MVAKESWENYADLPLMIPSFGLIIVGVYLGIGIILTAGLVLMVSTQFIAPWIMEVYASRKKVIRAVNYDDGIWRSPKLGIEGYGKSLLTFIYTTTPQSEQISEHGGEFDMGMWITTFSMTSPYEQHPRYGNMSLVKFQHDLPLEYIFRHDEEGWFTYLGFQIKGKVVHVISVDEVYSGPLHPRIENGETCPIYYIRNSAGLHDIRKGKKSMREVEMIIRQLRRSKLA